MSSSPIKKPFVLAGVISLLTITLMISPIYATENSDNARDQAERILQDKKYGQDSDQPLGDEAQRLTRWLGEGENKGEIKQRTDSEIRQESNEQKEPEITPPSLGGLSGPAMILLWVFLGLIIAGLAFLLYKFWPAKSKKDSQDESIDELPENIDWDDEEKVLEYITDAQLLENLSDKAEQEGHLDLALRYRFRAGLLRLNEMEIISFHPSITNAQWQLIIDNESFNMITKDFNDVTYGERTCDVQHLSRARSSWSTLTSKSSQANK